MGCMFCCMSEADKVDRVLTKFKSKNISSLDRLEPGDFPQSFSGVVAPLDKTLNTALNGGKECVYHTVTCHEEVEKTRTVEKDGRRHTETYFTREHRFTTTEQVDFVLRDPKGNSKKIIVPIGNTKFVSHCKMDGFSEQYQKGAVFPHHLNSLASRHKVYNTGHFKFKECSFDINETLCILGVVEEITLNGEVCFNVKPCVSSGLSEDFFTRNEWDDWDKRSWADLTKEPAIIITDSPVKDDTSKKTAPSDSDRA